MTDAPCDPAIIGRLAVLQSALFALPFPSGATSLVEAGVERVPGVGRARLTIAAEPLDPAEPPPDGLRFQLQTSHGRYGWFDVQVTDHDAFAPYEPYVSNLANAIALHAENCALYWQAREALQARERLTEIVSHDLRSPLTSVALGLDLLQRAALDLEGGERVARRVPPMRTAIEHMKRLIADLLDFDRVRAGRLWIERAPVGVRALFAEAAELLRPLADEKGVMLSWAERAPDAEVQGDHGRLVQVLANLVGNAVKFTPAGGGIQVASARDAGRLRITVCDSGPGIAPEFLPRVFERYAQQKRGDARGVGLGLAIARGIVEAHGGEIGIASELCKGTTVYFTLPLSAEAGSAPARGEPSLGPALSLCAGRGVEPARPCSVLIADDDADIREALADSLADEGWRVVQARDGQEALDMMMDAAFDAVLLDNRMPKLTGSEAYAQLLARGRRAPVIMITAATEAETLARSLGIEHFLAKPFAFDDLLGTLKRVAPRCPRHDGPSGTGAAAA